MPKIVVTLDTSELRKHRSLKSEQIQLIAELSKINSIDFYISELVLIEIISQEIEELNTSFQKIISELKDLKRKYGFEYVNIDSELNKYEEIKLNETANIENKWNEFRQKNRVRIISLSGVNNRSVFLDYKKGLPPFKKVRAKTDLPDSFIYHSLKTLNDREIYFVCNDSNLNDAASNLNNVVCFQSMEELLETEELKSKIKELENLGNLTKDFAVVEQQKELFEQLVKDFLFESIPIELLSPVTSKNPRIDKLIELKEVHYVHIQFESARLYSNSRIVLPVTINITGIVEYKQGKEEFYKIQEYPFFDNYLKYIKLKEEGDIVIVEEQYKGTLTTAINLKVQKPLQISKENITFSEIRKDLLVSSVFGFLAKEFEKK